MTDTKRRKFLKYSGLILGSLALKRNVSATPRELSLPLTPTPPDAEGPFYPRGDRSDDSEDLLRDMDVPRGETLRFAGRVVNTQGQPRSGLGVDIWQADIEGRYKHPLDGKAGERYADFAYWGQGLTNAQGQFSFRTYIPGAYSGRPAHIHYIIWEEDKRLLTSQVYFKGFETGTGAIIPSARHDLREARLVRANTTDFATDFRVVV